MGGELNEFNCINLLKDMELAESEDELVEEVDTEKAELQEEDMDVLPQEWVYEAQHTSKIELQSGKETQNKQQDKREAMNQGQENLAKETTEQDKRGSLEESSNNLQDKGTIQEDKEKKREAIKEGKKQEAWGPILPERRSTRVRGNEPALEKAQRLRMKKDNIDNKGNFHKNNSFSILSNEEITHMAVNVGIVVDTIDNVDNTCVRKIESIDKGMIALLKPVLLTIVGVMYM